MKMEKCTTVTIFHLKHFLIHWKTLYIVTSDERHIYHYNIFTQRRIFFDSWYDWYFMVSLFELLYKTKKYLKYISFIRLRIFNITFSCRILNELQKHLVF